MITLYDGSSKDFKSNGYGIIKDCSEAFVTEEINGSFELDLKCSNKTRLAELIKEENIIRCDASPSLKNQLFRIYRINKLLDDTLIVNAQHISYDLMTDFCKRANYRTISADGALQRIFDESVKSKHFKAFTDIPGAKDIDIMHSNIYNCIINKNESIVDVFYNEAELLRDNFNIHILKSRGKDKTLLAAEGKNIIDFEHTLDYSGLCTVIYPYCKIKEEWNGYSKTIDLPEQFIKSKFVKNYKMEYILPVDFTADNVRNVADLRREASKYFARTIVDIPISNFRAKLVNMDMSLGDRILVRIPSIGVQAGIKIVKMKYDVLNKRIDDIELGTLKKIDFGAGRK